MNPEIAWKTIGNINWASSRFRAFLPCKYLREAGWSCEIFTKKHIDNYKLVIFQKIYDRENLNLAKYLKHKGIKTVLDLCDNEFYNPHNCPKLRQKGEQLQRMIDTVDMVSVSTPELAKLIKGKQVIVIDDLIEFPKNNFLVDSYFKLRKVFQQDRSNLFKVVWYGNSRESLYLKAGIFDLLKILPCMEELSHDIPLSLTVISNSQTLFNKYLVGQVSFPIEYYDWKLKTFPYLCQENDVCIIPINLNPWSICKTNNRLLLSLLLCIPVVADVIPSYQEFQNFVLFSNWKNSLFTYATKPSLRKMHVKAGQDYISTRYAKHIIVEQWSSLFYDLIS